MKQLLAPLSFIYAAVMRLRNGAYDHGLFRAHRARCSVISVGNITAGGNGKTPLCRVIIEILKADGLRPVVLTRGYGGQTVGPVEVRRNSDPRIVGDEPVMLAADCAVVVARDRVRGAEFITSHDLGDVIVLDDGFQHRRLARDLDLVCVYAGTEDARRDFAKGRCLPWGLFREPRKAGLARADGIVLSQRAPGGLDEGQIALLSSALPQGVPVFQSVVREVRVTRAAGERLAHGATVAAFCALGNPDGFFRSLASLGFCLVTQEGFPDHAALPGSRLERALGDPAGHAVVVTQKDWVKLSAHHQARVWVADIETAVAPLEPFREQIRAAVTRFRSRAVQHKSSGEVG